jgi:hypothetical protein
MDDRRRRNKEEEEARRKRKWSSLGIHYPLPTPLVATKALLRYSPTTARATKSNRECESRKHLSLPTSDPIVGNYHGRTSEQTSSSKTSTTKLDRHRESQKRPSHYHYQSSPQAP